MIDELVSQIETRFAELERELSDPLVIGDRERFTSVSRAYSELEPAAKLAAEYRRAVDDFEGARELLAEDWRDRRAPRPARVLARADRRRSRRRSAWRWSSATPTTTRT